MNIDASGFLSLFFTSVFLVGALGEVDEALECGFSLFSFGAKIGASLDDVFAILRGGSVSDIVQNQVSEIHTCFYEH